MKEIPVTNDSFLRLFTLEDAPGLNRIFTNEAAYIQDYHPWPAAILRRRSTVEACQELITEWQQKSDQETGQLYGYFSSRNNHIGGVIGYQRTDCPGSFELIYWLAEGYRHSLQNQPAFETYLDQLFSRVDVRRVVFYSWSNEIIGGRDPDVLTAVNCGFELEPSPIIRYNRAICQEITVYAYILERSRYEKLKSVPR